MKYAGGYAYSTEMTTKIEGTSGNDALYGGNYAESIFGYDGDDLISGGGGNDRLFGGNHKDTIYGGFGDDLLDGGDDRPPLGGPGRMLV